MVDLYSEILEDLKNNNEEAYTALSEAFVQGSAKKGDILISSTSICDKLYILQSGITKQFRNTEKGGQHVTWFNYPGDSLTSFKSFVNEEVTDEGVEVIVDCDFLVVSKKTLYQLCSKYHAAETLYRKALEFYLIESEERSFFMQTLTASEKYAYLFKLMPERIQDLPQTELASFLGITRETLSRIRAKTIL